MQGKYSENLLKLHPPGELVVMAVTTLIVYHCEFSYAFNHHSQKELSQDIGLSQCLPSTPGPKTPFKRRIYLQIG